MEQEDSNARGKRPPNHFLLFCKANRAKLQSENPDLSPGDVTRVLSERWKAMSQQERQPFVEEAQQAAATFKAANPEYHYNKCCRRKKPAKIKQPDAFELKSCRIEIIPSVRNDKLKKLMWIGAQSLAHTVLANKELKDDLCRWVHESVMVASHDSVAIIPQPKEIGRKK